MVGLGTGSTALHFLEALAGLVRQGREIVGVPTSEDVRRRAGALGIVLAPSSGPWDIDVTVDGADEVSDSLDLLKGSGAALTREKIVNEFSRTNVIVVDDGKRSARLGERCDVVLEVLLFGHEAIARVLSRFGRPRLRCRDGSPAVTDAGNLLYDLSCGVIEDPRRLDRELHAIPGVVETGLFCGRADVVLVAGPDRVEELRKPRATP